MSDLSFLTTALRDATPKNQIQKALATLRGHLDMDVAFVTEFSGGRIFVRAIDPVTDCPFDVGAVLPGSSLTPKGLSDGTMVQLIGDTSDHAPDTVVAVTDAFPVRAQLCLPIFREDGTVFGALAAVSRSMDRSLNQRDLDVAKAFCNVIQEEVRKSIAARDRVTIAMDRISNAMESQAFKIDFQPIHELATGRVAGFEALCRFDALPYRSPDQWFDEAADVGLGIDLEYCVLETALEALSALPDPLFLSVNAGPDLISSERLTSLFAQYDADRVILEVTEHIEITNPARLMRALRQVRDLGVRVAVDDAGAGYSGLQQLLRLRPEVIKLDRSLVSEIDSDPARRALCAALMHYTTETGAKIVAEGIETDAEAETLTELGVHRGQGWLLGKPMSLADALEHSGITFGHKVAAL